MKWTYPRPKFAGRAAFKVLLKRNGFRVPRDFYGRGCCVALKSNRQWRFRFNDGEADISCELWNFDRWANSTDETVNLEELKAKLK